MRYDAKSICAPNLNRLDFSDNDLGHDGHRYTEADDLAQDKGQPQSLHAEDTCGEAWHAEIDCELALMARAHDADSTQAHRVREHNQLRRYVGEAQGRITSDIEEIQKWTTETRTGQDFCTPLEVFPCLL